MRKVKSMVEIVRGSSPQELRRANERHVLRHAWRVGPFTASDAMAATGLTRSTVIGVCDDLVAYGWLLELGDARAVGDYTKGRPARRYALRERAAVVVGVDAGYGRITATVADLRGQPLGRASVEIPGRSPTDVERVADAVARRSIARDVVRNALRSSEADPADVLATTIAVPAPVDAHGASPADDWFWGLTNPGYAEEFAGASPIVMVENDANLAAIAEQVAHEGAGRGANSFIALLTGEGMGAGLMLDGRLVRGRRGGAGEMRFLDHVEGVGSANGAALLARRWAVEAISAGLPLDSELARLDPETLDEVDVATAATAGDPAAIEIIDRIAARLARICLVLGDLLDVDRIIVGGAVVVTLPAVIQRAAAMLLQSDDPTAPDLVPSVLGPEAVGIGAIEHSLALVRERALDLPLRVRDVA